MSDVLPAGHWALRAAACELLALSFRYPTPELAETVASGEWTDASEEIAAALGVSLSEEFSSDARAAAEGPSYVDAHDSGLGMGGGVVSFGALRAEATRLFVGAPDAECSPYEGVWRAVDDGVPALLFVNPHSMEVELFCRSCGLGRPEGTNEPLDYVSTEIELLQYLASLAAGLAAAAPNGPSLEELPGGSAAAAYERFLDEHALVWMPRFAEAVAAKTRLPFYRAAAMLLEALLDNGALR